MVSAPRCDVVEIGAYFGKSAAWLTLIARGLDTGNVLAIDPWLPDEAVQYDAPLHVQRLSDGDYWETVAQACVMNLIPIASERFNFLRMPATQALPQYESGRVYSTAFGATAFSGQVALLHIDGNHDYRAVAADVAQWAPKLAPSGGWSLMTTAGPMAMGRAGLAMRFLPRGQMPLLRPLLWMARCSSSLGIASKVIALISTEFSF